MTAGRHAGPLPATASLASVEPPAAILTALKPRGNPLAPEDAAGAPSPADGVTIRLRDAGQGPVTARVRLFTGLTAARGLSLTEDARGEPVALTDGAAPAVVPAAGVATLAVTPAPWPAAAPADPARPAEPAGPAGPPEPAQPVYARYWLHGKGPAPAGNLPVAVHLSPARVAVDSSLTRSLRLTVACGPDPAAGEIRLAIPPGLDVQPAGPLRYDLASRGHAGMGPGRPGPARGGRRAPLRHRRHLRPGRPADRGRRAGRRRRAGAPPSRRTGCGRGCWRPATRRPGPSRPRWS